jgi:hypothetical protein
MDDGCQVMAIAHTGELKRLICEFVTYMYIKKKIEGNRYFCSLNVKMA